jgi:hypothetical protein
MRPTRTVIAALLSVLAFSLALAGCGGSSSSDNGTASKSPEQILEASKQAARQASSVHIVGTITSEGKPITLDMELLAGKGGKGTISQEGFKIQIIQTGGAVYINGSSDFYKHVTGSAPAAALLQGKWLKAPANSGELASLAELTDLSKLIDTALASHGTLSKGEETTIEGQKAIPLKDKTKGGTLYVAATGKPYPLQISKEGKESGKVTFNRWDQPVTLNAPSGAIDISKLQNGG